MAENQENAFVSAVEETPAPAPNTTPEEEEINLSAENTLNGIAVFTLIAGIIATFICLFTICWIRNPEYKYLDEKIFNPGGFATTVAILIGSLATWALLKVLANISITLKQINKKIK